MMKIKQRHRDRMATYLRYWKRSRDVLRFTMYVPGECWDKACAEGWHLGKWKGGPAIPAIRAFFEHESTGAIYRPEDSKKVDRAMCGKALLALQIKMWAQGMAEGLHGTVELQEYCPQWFPEWVWRSVRTQSMRCKPLFPSREVDDGLELVALCCRRVRRVALTRNYLGVLGKVNGMERRETTWRTQQPTKA